MKAYLYSSLCLILIACDNANQVSDSPPKSVIWYQSHTPEMEDKLTACGSNSKKWKNDKGCYNAQKARVENEIEKVMNSKENQ